MSSTSQVVAVVAANEARGMTDETWFQELQSLLSFFVSFYMHVITFRKGIYIKIGQTGQADLKDRGCMITDKVGRKLPWRILVHMHDCIPRWSKCQTNIWSLKQNANLESLMHHLLSAETGGPAETIYDA